LTAKQTEIASALAAWDALIASVIAQEAEEARQLAIKGLADADKVTQDALVVTLTSTRDTASTAKDDADTASSDATTAKTDAQSAYDAQVTVADGTAATVSSPLSDLGVLRGTAATAGTTLATARSALNDQDALITSAVDALETA
jgi:hypothetical protein